MNMKDICNFINFEKSDDKISYYHFVYQNGTGRLKQPFYNPFYRVNLVTKGTGILKQANMEMQLKKGDLFFTFPYISYTLNESEDLSFLYISFDGCIAENLLRDLNIDIHSAIYCGYEHLIAFWMESIRRFTTSNAQNLTDCVFKYTLSYLSKDSEEETKKEIKIKNIINYIEANYATPSLSLQSVADMFFYSDKYFSAIFKKEVGVNFTEYLNEMRINHAIKDIKSGITSVYELASSCGFADQFYFSNVFKKFTGVSPTEYIKKSQK